jgi:hypothetical protein
MKKAFILCVALSTTLFTNAQETTPAYSPAVEQEVKPVRLGFAIAPALTWLSSETKQLNTQGLRFGFAYGVTVDFSIAKSNNYSLATGFMIGHTGGKLNYAEGASLEPGVTPMRSGRTEYNAKLQYINVPITLKLKTNEIGYMSYFGQFGVLGGVKIGAKKDGQTSFDNPSSVVPYDNEGFNDDSRLFNAGLLIGLGAEYNISGSTNLVFGIQYFRGFTNVLDLNLDKVDKDGLVEFNLPENDITRIPNGGPRASAFLNQIALSIGVIF